MGEGGGVGGGGFNTELLDIAINDISNAVTQPLCMCLA